MKLKVVSFGEVLWDCFPSHKEIGGAPLNVALRLHSFFNNVAFISKVGNDAYGHEILEYLKTENFNLNYIQIDNAYPTGTVEVVLDNHKNASYKISNPAAWDFIECSQNEVAITQQSDVFIFGSLSARNKTSRDTLLQLLDKAKFKVFDVNIRLPFYNIIDIMMLAKKADFIKVNDDELFKICDDLGSRHFSLEKNMSFLAKYTQTEFICVTQGASGGVLLYKEKFYYNGGYKVDIADTVGSGDSFLASLVHQLLVGKSPKYALDYACAVGAMVAKNIGANPKISTKEINDFMS